MLFFNGLHRFRINRQRLAATSTQHSRRIRWGLIGNPVLLSGIIEFARKEWPSIRPVMWPVAILCALFFGAGYVTKQELDASAVANLTTDNQRLRDQTGASVAGQAGMTLEEKRDLAAALGSIVGSVMVVYVPLEGETYAGDLRSAFAAAGWTAIATPSVLPPPPGARVAVSLEVVDDKQRDVVKCALTVARLPYAIQPWTNGTPSEFIWLPPLTP